MSSFWDTSAGGLGPSTKPMDLATLGEHKAQCSKASSHWLALRCYLGLAFDVIAARPVTTGVTLIVALVVLLVWP